MSNQTSDDNKRIAKNTLLLYLLYRSLWGDVYSKDVEMTENIMSEEQYNELLKAYTKEALASSKHPTPILAVWTISATFAPC